MCGDSCRVGVLINHLPFRQRFVSGGAPVARRAEFQVRGIVETSHYSSLSLPLGDEQLITPEDVISGSHATPARLRDPATETIAERTGNLNIVRRMSHATNGELKDFCRINELVGFYS